MKNTKRCPKCSSPNIVRVPDNQNRHANGNNIYTVCHFHRQARRHDNGNYGIYLGGRIVFRYKCCNCSTPFSM